MAALSVTGNDTEGARGMFWLEYSGRGRYKESVVYVLWQYYGRECTEVA